ncbi:MAG: hypothetical protein AMXMBFR61_16920 [Fimbriimonadales bacterium]
MSNCDEMNARERFHATMHYLPRDRCPIMDFGFWEETLIEWRRQGMPEESHPDDFFGMDPQWIEAPIRVGMWPVFDTLVLEDLGETRIVRDCDGVTKLEDKRNLSIPKYLDHTLKDRQSWEREFRWRLNGQDPTRYSAEWPEFLRRALDPARDYPIGVPAGSLYGWLRDWMGVEAISYLVHEDRTLFEEMVATVTQCIMDAITPALESGVHCEYASMWEDMCYRAGPLISPKVFAEVLVPQYQRITSLLRRYGVDVVVLDCDGDISLLAPLWLQAGVNTMFPIEVGVWGLDPVALRRQYGREMLLIGGVSKLILASDEDAIRREVERLAPLVEEGGYIPTPDHRVPPDVPLENYVFYIEEAKRVWGKSLPNLRPTGRPAPVRTS